MTYFATFNLVIASNLGLDDLVAVGNACEKLSVPLVVLRSYGFIGYVRIHLMYHEVTESKPDKDQFDLRLANPFPALVSYCTKFDLASMDTLEHSHVPYVVLLYQALEKWKLEVCFGNIQVCDPLTSMFAARWAMSQEFQRKRTFQRKHKRNVSRFFYGNKFPRSSARGLPRLHYTHLGIRGEWCLSCGNWMRIE